MDLYTAANPFVIVCFQLLITASSARCAPIRSIVIGTVIIGLSMVINLVPDLLAPAGCGRSPRTGCRSARCSSILTVALIAFGELFTSPRMYEYIGALAPKGQEGLFLGYANLPMAIGSLIGGPVGAFIFNEIMAKDATTRPDGLLELVPSNNALGWIILMAIGLLSALAHVAVQPLAREAPRARGGRGSGVASGHRKQDGAPRAPEVALRGPRFAPCDRRARRRYTPATFAASSSGVRSRIASAPVKHFCAHRLQPMHFEASKRGSRSSSRLTAR